SRPKKRRQCPAGFSRCRLVYPNYRGTVKKIRKGSDAVSLFDRWPPAFPATPGRELAAWLSCVAELAAARCQGALKTFHDSITPCISSWSFGNEGTEKRSLGKRAIAISSASNFADQIPHLQKVCFGGQNVPQT